MNESIHSALLKNSSLYVFLYYQFWADKDKENFRKPAAEWKEVINKMQNQEIIAYR